MVKTNEVSPFCGEYSAKVNPWSAGPRLYGSMSMSSSPSPDVRRSWTCRFAFGTLVETRAHLMSLAITNLECPSILNPPPMRGRRHVEVTQQELHP
jgi:hypothetical protein